MGITCSSTDRYVHCRQSTTIIKRTCSSPFVVLDIADVYNKNRQRVPQESTGICLSGVVYHHHKYHGLDITLMQKRVAILTITAKPYPEGSAVSHAVLCNPTILWGDLEIKKQVPGRLPSQLPSGETIVYGILSKHSKISAEVTLKGILVDREVRIRASISSNDIASEEEVIRLHSDLKQWQTDETMEKEPFMIKDNIEMPKEEKRINDEILVTEEEIVLHDEIRVTKSPKKKTDVIHLTKQTFVLHDGIGNQVVNHEETSSVRPLSKSLEDLSGRQSRKLPLKRLSYSGIAFTNQLSSFSLVSSTHTVSSEMMNGGHLFVRNELQSFKLGGPVNNRKTKRRDTPIVSFLKAPTRKGNKSSPSNIAQDDGLMQDGAQYITDCCMNMGGGASNVFDIFREKLCNSRKSANQSAKLSEAMSAGTSRNRPGTRRLSLGGTEQHIKSLSTGMHICHIEVQRSFQCRSSDDISTHQCSAQCNCSNPIGLTEMKRISTSIDLSKSDRNTSNGFQRSETIPCID